ncbi:MAG: leucine-rich repeat protein [Clostridia bacterium]|nr:leucine-rich repeat protein [Clostridia bacterium]
MERFTKKSLALFLALMMVAGILPFASIAEIDFSSWFVKAEAGSGSYLTSGYCGDTSDGKDGTDIYWEIDSDGVLTLTGTGPMDGSFVADLRINKVIIGNGIENVSDGAFNQCTNLTTAILPGSIKSIGKFAFAYTGLEEISIPSNLEVIDSSAFACAALTSLELPGSVRQVNSSAFLENDIETLELSEGLESIGRLAFSQNSLTALEIPDSVISIGKSAFSHNNIGTLTIGTGLPALSENVFSDNSALASVVIPSNITEIKNGAFIRCADLENVQLNEGITIIGDGAFSNTAIEEIRLPESLITLGAAFRNTALQSIYIGKNLQHVSASAFGDYSLSVEVDISAENESFAIYDDVIYNLIDSDIALFPIDKTIVEFPSWISSPTATKIGKNVTALSVAAGSEYLTVVDNILYTKNLSTLIFCPRSRGGDILIPDGVENIGPYAFRELKINGTVNIIFSDSVRYVSEYAFLNLEKREPYTLNIALNEGLISIGEWAFTIGGTLEELRIPDSCVEIGELAFSGCYAKRIYLGSGITGDLGNLRTLDITESIEVSESNPYYASYDGNLYKKNPTSLVLALQNKETLNLPEWYSFPAGFIYEMSDSSYKNIFVAENNSRAVSVDGIIYSKDMSELWFCPVGRTEDVNVPEGVKVIGAWAFRQSSVQNICLPSSLHTIRDQAFLNTTFPAIEIPYGVTMIGGSAFSWSKIKEITLPDSVTEIGGAVFSNCSNLEKVRLSDNIKEIPSDTFNNCTQLEELNIPKNCIKIHDFVFNHGNVSDGNLITSFTLPETLQSWSVGYLSLKNLSEITVLSPNTAFYGFGLSNFANFADDTLVRGYCGSPAHEMAIKRMFHWNSLGHTFLDWYVATPATYEHDGLEKRDCAYCDHSEERVIPRLQRDTYTATFMADGKVVGYVDFQKGASAIEEPAVPAKDRYTGAWEAYTLSDSDITVNAVYTLIKSDDAQTLDSDSSAALYYDTDDVLFKVSASSAAKTVKSVVAKSVPLDIVLVVDQSGSMEDPLGGSVKKVDALKSAAHDFIDAVAQNAALTGAAHRIGVVGFGLAGKYSGYLDNENSELLTSGRGVVPFAEITPADYASSLISIADKSVLDAAVDGIEARGATAADLGLEMAKGVFANTDSAGRERVVVFMTDGEPTYTNGFQTAVANSAIANAGLLKKTYGASVFSVGVFDAAQSRSTDIQTFMNAVSSDYPQAASMRSPGARVSDHYYITVNDTAKLSEVFRTITTESLSHTASFDNVTLIKTLSKYVTLTAPQEQTLRVDAIRKYGISNDQITVTRNDDGTTLIRLEGLTPYEAEKDGKIIYEVSLEFFASLNENAAAAADYTVDGEDSGVMLGDAIGYETTFDTNDITLSENKTRYLFTINGELYEIAEGSSVSAAKPATDFPADWQFSGWNTNGVASANGVIVDATLVKAPRTVVWHTVDGDVSQVYTEGEFLNPPAVADRADGSKFLSWNKSLPTVMPDEDLEFTAVYGEHIHRYTSSIEQPATCETEGVMRFDCVCGDTYAEPIASTGHHFEAVAPSTEQDASHCTFVCTNCGQRYEYALDYQITVRKNWGRSISYEFQLTDDDLQTGFEPDGAIDIRIPLSEIQVNAYHVTVTRTVNGVREPVPAEIEDGFLIIKADHFTPYDINFVFACEETGEHTDEDADGFCDLCGEEMPAPEEPTEPTTEPGVDPADPENPAAPAACDLCGDVHPDTFGGNLVRFIHTIIYILMKLFGKI